MNKEPAVNEGNAAKATPQLNGAAPSEAASVAAVVEDRWVGHPVNPAEGIPHRSRLITESGETEVTLTIAPAPSTDTSSWVSSDDVYFRKIQEARAKATQIPFPSAALQGVLGDWAKFSAEGMRVT